MQEALAPQPGTLAKLALTAVIASAVLLLAATARPTRSYYMVDELVSHDLSRMTSELKVHGWILAGSIKERGSDRTFVLHKSGKRLRVVSQQPLPDMVRDQSELVVTGELVPAEADDDLPYVLAASEVSAKCATRYDAGMNKNLKFE